MQSRDPSLDLVHDTDQSLLVHVNPPDPLKQLFGFCRIELQVGLADFYGQAAGLHRDQGKRGIAPGYDDQVQAAGRMLQQPVQQIMDIRMLTR